MPDLVLSTSWEGIWRAKRNSLQRKDMDDIVGALACPQDGTSLRKVMTVCGFWAQVTSAAAIATISRVLEGTCPWAANVEVKTNGNANSLRTSTPFNMVAYSPFESFCSEAILTSGTRVIW
jgi:hypothetical protein